VSLIEIFRREFKAGQVNSASGTALDVLWRRLAAAMKNLRSLLSVSVMVLAVH